ncbi:MAG: phosphoribosylformylglycinamidine synthase subunit PurQ [Verrucomicrobiota bacterium]
MKFVVIQFPGSNCDQDCYRVLKEVFGEDVRYVWHKDSKINKDETIILPGGFSYGDYLRCGAVARFSPVMESVKKAAADGQFVLGICNGFQILCEAGLLPGALVRNQNLHFICEHARIKVENNQTIFTTRYEHGEVLDVPIAHGEGCYLAEPDVLKRMEENKQVVFRYVDDNGEATAEGNPNGSMNNIAGICNETRNVLGMMPHPERACEMLLQGTDGRGLFESLIAEEKKSFLLLDV